MATKQSALRIHGLVRLMNQVRDQLRNGVPPEDAAAFRATVRQAIRTVDNICHVHKITPEALPKPSQRAYAYLKELDLTHLPKPKKTRIVSQGSIRVPGIISTCNSYHRRFSALVHKEPGPYTIEQPTVQDLLRRLRSESEAIAGVCEDVGGSPAALPARSQRGYQWLNFLSESGRLTQHLQTLATLYKVAQRRKRLKDTRLSIRIFPSSSLYRTKGDRAACQISINEGFIAAPQQILERLMAAALNSQNGTANQEAVRTYSLSQEFNAIQVSLVSQTQILAGSAEGQYHNLDIAFDRVNHAYFGGKSERPRLVWSRRPSSRKLGHYDQAQDTVLVSMSLDAENVPAYVVDFVVYHELLHKHLGVTVVNGRRHAHTPDFRKKEREFKDYERAQAFVTAHSQDI